MKKIITLLVIFAFGNTLIAQDNATMESIVQRYEALKNSPLNFDYVIDSNFNAEEKQMLLSYLDQKNPSESSSFGSLVPDYFLALDIRNGGVFGSLDGTPPFDTFDVINTNGINAFADDFDGNGVLYALDFDANLEETTLYTVDPTTGSASAIEVVTGFLADHSPSGLSYNSDDGLMYVLSTNGSATQLYTLNLITGVLTIIGPGTGNPLGIWLVIDNDGNGWMADIGTDQFYSLNLTTGSALAVGPLDIDIAFAQDASYDHETNELFMAAYFGGGSGGIYSVNMETGLASFIGQTNPLDVEFGMFSVPDPSLGVADQLARGISVFPNPVQEELQFRIRPEMEMRSARLYNVLGNDTGVVYSNGTMNVSKLPQGVYILIMETSEGKLSQKIVKH
ncbi:MAG: T9SS type A sorting domain-containing protein [Flavobacteriaceae bacterium]|nr:T9SS type A sorting domain-containing protein [Flavobacteriaceae bacterium]